MYRGMTSMEDIFSRGDEQHLRIVLLGVSGAGKSSMANAILGRMSFKESRTRESEIQRGRVADRNISIIDTPGFFNSQLTDEELQNQMVKSLYLCHPGPHVFLLIINLETFRKDERNIVEQIQENFGVPAFKFTLVLFTGREQMSNREWVVFMDSRHFQDIVNHCRGKYHSINSKSEIAQTHITKLLDKIDEIIKQNNGQHYNTEIYSVFRTRSKKEKNKQEEEKDRTMEPMNEMRQEQIKIVQDTFEMDNVRVERIEKEQLVSHVEETVRTRVYEENIDKGNMIRTSSVRSLAIFFDRKDEIKTVQTPKVGKTRTWALKKQQTTTEQHLTNAVLRIVLVGKTGAGKSATGNTILRKKLFDEQLSSESVTKKCQKHQQMMESKIISVIDTPGLFDTSMSEEELKEELVKCVEMSVPGPHVFLLVIRLDVRFTEEEKNAVKWIQDNFGKYATNYTIVLLTRGDQLASSIEEFLTKNEPINKLVSECKGGYHVFDNKDEENKSQVSHLIEKIDRMVNKNGGEHYTNEMYKKAKRKLMLNKCKHAALVGAGVAGVGAAVAGGTLLGIATAGVAVPVVLMAGGAALTGGSTAKVIVDKVNKK